MAIHHKFGKKGEETALSFIRDKGYTLLELNYRLHPYEVDIIAQDRQTIVFIEVKTRFTDEYGHPTSFITHKKERNLIQVADYYLQHVKPGFEGRFDVITLYLHNQNFVIEHFPNAFTARD